jgi:ferredoxin
MPDDEEWKMAIRQVVKIDEDLCTGCGECVPACAEGAIQIIDGVARLVADNLCDGLGACLGECPEGAITVEEREADAFDEEIAKKHMKNLEQAKEHKTIVNVQECGCPGARVIEFDAPKGPTEDFAQAQDERETSSSFSELRQWPVQLHLVPPTAPYFKRSNVLLAADCVAFAVGDFHRRFLKGQSLAVACPKLDQGQETYLQKLIAMIDQAEINTLTVIIMEVPCCGGLVELAREAAARATRKVPVKKIVVGLRGEILKEEWL